MTSPRAGTNFAKLAIAVLVLLFGVLAAWAVADKSATYDENVHAPAGWTYLKLRDYRVNPEHPVLWKYWAALPNLGGSFTVDTSAESWNAIPGDLSRQWEWSIQTMYRTPTNNPDQFIQRSRRMMILSALPLGLLIAVWSWRLGGAAAAVIGVFAFALDPNFLAHAALVTNDVPFSLMMLACALCAWWVGRRLTWPNALLLALATGVAVNTKYSGVLVPPIIGLLLLLRAMLPGSWPAPAFGRNLDGRFKRLLAALGLCVALAVGTWAVTWAAYGFRYSTGPNVSMNLDQMLGIELYNRFYLANPHAAIESPEHEGELIAQWQLESDYRPAPISQLCVWLRKHRLLPEPFLFGVLHVYANSLIRRSFLLGQFSNTGWWYYFPLAILFKTPTATLGAIVVALGVLWRKIEIRRQKSEVSSQKSEDGANPEHRTSSPHLVTLSPCHLVTPLLWNAICLTIPPLLYLAQIMGSNMNLGVRHTFPVYPFVFIGLGLALGRLWRDKAGRVVVSILGLMLAAETVAAFPNFIAFFNLPSVVLAGPKGKLHLLGDSNLDWGQELPAVAKWQQQHPQDELYLGAFGMSDPAWYGIKYHNLSCGYRFGPPSEAPTDPSVVAISATHLQGIYIGGDDQLTLVETLRAQKPIAILGGGAIYLYRWPREKSEK